MLSFFFLAAVWVRALIASRHHVHETLVVVIELATLAAALFALCWIAIYCMRELQVVWLDSILVAIGLFAHYVAAPFVKGTFPGWFRRSGGET